MGLPCRASCALNILGQWWECRRQSPLHSTATEDGKEGCRMDRGGRRKDIMRLKWIAQRLHMGSWTYVNLLNEQPQIHPQAQEELRLCQ